MQEIIVDLFCGGGGASKGIEQALGVPVTIAINHDPESIRMHWLNHPKTRHIPEDIWKLDPLKVTGNSPIGLLWASPDCTHHSKAKGGKPRSNKRRSLADVVVEWAKLVKPRIIMLENVPEFEDWGPLNKEDMPVKELKGMDFKRWVNELRNLGYTVEWKLLKACDYGVPTSRERLFLIARCDGKAIVWPEPTHGKKRLPYRVAAECIDFSLPCPSIFERKRPLVENTMRRIAKGLRKFVIESGDPFILAIDNKSSNSATWPITEPLRTVTMENRFAVVTPFLTKYHGAKGEETRGQVCDEPLRTLDTQNRFGLVSAFLTKFYNTNIGSDMREPLPTVTSGGQHIGEVRAFLIKYYGCGIGQSVKEPLHTLTCKDRLGLVTVHGQQYQIADIGLRMLTPLELLKAHDFPEQYVLVGTRTSQVARIGNSVPPTMARVLVNANVKLQTSTSVKAG